MRSSIFGHCGRMWLFLGVTTTTTTTRTALAFATYRPSWVQRTSRLGLSTTTSFSFDPPLQPADHTVLIGKASVLEDLSVSKTVNLNVHDTTLQAMKDRIGKSSGSASTFVEARGFQLLLLPSTVSRNNHPLSVHTITDTLSKLPSASCCSTIQIIVCAQDIQKHVGALVLAVAKAFPKYSRKTSSQTDQDHQKDRHVHLTLLDHSNDNENNNNNNKSSVVPSNEWLQAVIKGVQLAQELVDTTPDELTTTAYANQCRTLAHDLVGVSYSDISGDDLAVAGYGGLYGVGKAATHPPKLVLLDYTPATIDPEKETVALVGKGIVYDTGGLSLKTKTGMPGMKHDCGGSAGLLGAFVAAVAMQLPQKLSLVLCLAENAIGPNAVRNDDVLTLYSGKTVEINNSDAEGRLVLGDGVAHACKHVDHLDLIVDMATLTGAQLIATGKKHAGILANSLELEQRAVQAGLSSGDLAFPLLYAPELLKSEFNSKVADMRNSVKDRGNAQSSCAGHFIESHLHNDYKGKWLHVDMAGPVMKGGRATGYGVGLVLSLLGAEGF